MKQKRIRRIATLLASCIAFGCFLAPYRSWQVAPSVSAKTISEIDAEKKTKQAALDEKEEELKRLSNDIADQEAYQKVLQEKIDLINEELYLIDTQLQGLKADIAIKESDIATLQQQIEQQQTAVNTGMDAFKTRIRTLYIHGNDSLLSALVGATDFYDVLAKIDLINRIATHDDEMVKQLTEELTTLATSQQDLNERMQALNIKVKETESIRTEYATKQVELNTAMAETTEVKQELEKQKQNADKDIQEYQEYIDSLDKEKNSILEAAKKAAADEAARKLQQQQQQQNPKQPTQPVVIPPSSMGGTLAWPAPGFYYVSSGYGMRWGRLHSGIDIASAGIHGASACAAAGGTVTKVVTGCGHDYACFCYCGGGYGNYVMVNHGNGLVTLYAHLCDVSVSVGDTVAAGTVVGHIGATGNSTGYHLHFSVIVNGTFVNPTGYLN